MENRAAPQKKRQALSCGLTNDLHESWALRWAPAHTQKYKYKYKYKIYL